MLELQKFLNGSDGSYEDCLRYLDEKLGITTVLHPTLPLRIFNYNQIRSPKTDPIVRECRGLVLDDNTWEIAAKGFSRFFNWGETDEHKEFNWSDCVVQEKIDGSLVLLYNYKGRWMANTRGSFGLDRIQGYDVTWQEGFLRALGVDSLDELDNCLNKCLTYVCEFVSPWNKVVRKYEKPAMYLLSIFYGKDEVGVPEDYNSVYFSLPNYFEFSSSGDVIDYLAYNAGSDPTFEGFVIRDILGLRFKLKSPTYLGLHRMRGNDGFQTKNLLPFYLAGNKDELLLYFDEARSAYQSLETTLDGWARECNSIYNYYKDVPTQKDYALKVKDHFLSGLLFQARQKRCNPSDLFKDNEEYLLKKLSAATTS